MSGRVGSPSDLSGSAKFPLHRSTTMLASVWHPRLALPRLLMRGLIVLLLWLVLPVGANAKDTGYVFVSHERTNNVAVIDPKQEYRIIKWIATSGRPRGMKFRDDGKQLLV